MKRFGAVLLVGAAGCLCRPAPPPLPPPELATRAPAAVSVSQDPAGSATAHVLVVDLRKQPLANMMPIATRLPNAFDQPLAQGALTGPDGKGSVVVPGGERICVRAWDPALNMFANNYFEVLPESAADTALMTVVMVPGASLDVVLYTPGVTPAANQNVGIMMFHPTEGAWWPAEADTDSRGAVHFASLPAGTYTLKIKAAGGGQTEIRDVNLPPGGKTDLGAVLLQ